MQIFNLGYLAYDRTFKTAFIPNEEIHQELILATKKKKWDKNVRAALDQIKDRKYPESVVGYAGELLLVGINYNEKTKEHECQIEKYEK